MALDPRIPLQGGLVPDLVSAASGGLGIADQIRSQPLRRALQLAQVKNAQQQQLRRQRFIGSPVRVERDGQQFLSGLVQTPEGDIRLSQTRVEGDFISPLGETALEQSQRKADDAKAISQIRTEAAGREVTTKGQAQRQQGIIDSGLDAASALPTVNRSLSLLDQIDTGGFNSVLLKAKQAFGVEGADEGELSANLGKAVLSQLRSTFGAAFTEREGARLENIEAGFGKSAATNKRLLGNLKQILEREVKRARRSAEKTGDQDTIDDLNELMEFQIEPEQPVIQQELPDDLNELLQFMTPEEKALFNGS